MITVNGQEVSRVEPELVVVLVGDPETFKSRAIETIREEIGDLISIYTIEAQPKQLEEAIRELRSRFPKC